MYYNQTRHVRHKLLISSARPTSELLIKRKSKKSPWYEKNKIWFFTPTLLLAPGLRSKWRMNLYFLDVLSLSQKKNQTVLNLTQKCLNSSQSNTVPHFFISFLFWASMRQEKIELYCWPPLSGYTTEGFWSNLVCHT